MPISFRVRLLSARQHSLRPGIPRRRRPPSTVGRTWPRRRGEERFTSAVGRPPASYLLTHRLGHTARLLGETDAPLAAIAHRTGYSTEYELASTIVSRML